MREILFRAKTEPNCKDVITGKIIKNPKWMYGYVDLGYMHDCRSPLIGDEKGNKVYKCQYETIGQFTGLTDKNGTRIFEGDIVESEFTQKPYLVCFGEYTYTNEYGEEESACGWYNVEKGGYVTAFGCPDAWATVIGNIHDNPELLGGASHE